MLCGSKGEAALVGDGEEVVGALGLDAVEWVREAYGDILSNLSKEEILGLLLAGLDLGVGEGSHALPSGAGCRIWPGRKERVCWCGWRLWWCGVV